jgi:hypothetical protein
MHTHGFRRLITAVLVALAWLSAHPAQAQNVSMLQSPRTVGLDGDGDPIRLAVPVAASSDLGGENQRGVSPTLGFQIWQRDRFFVGAFFTIATTNEAITDNYGAFLLNPPLKGHSFYISGNYLAWPSKGSRSPLKAGVGGRWGTTSAGFEFTPPAGTVQKLDGFGTVASITGQFVTRTFDVSLGDTTGEFQLGVETGPTWRGLGGDLGEDDALRRQILGTDRAGFWGWETTFFLRVNDIQPFARFSSFGRPDGTVIHGFTGRQVVWGVNVASTLFQTHKQ